MSDNTGWDPEMMKAMEQPINCPDCLTLSITAPMRLCQKESELFYGCSRFPECKTTHRAFQEGSHVGAPVGVPVPRAVRQLRSRAYELANSRWNLTADTGKREFAKWCGRKIGVSIYAAGLTAMSQGQLERIVTLLETNAK